MVDPHESGGDFGHGVTNGTSSSGYKDSAVHNITIHERRSSWYLGQTEENYKAKKERKVKIPVARSIVGYRIFFDTYVSMSHRAPDIEPKSRKKVQGFYIIDILLFEL